MGFDPLSKRGRANQVAEVRRMNVVRVRADNCAEGSDTPHPVTPQLRESPHGIAAATRHRDHNVEAA
jgi:hypothetical protein